MEVLGEEDKSYEVGIIGNVDKKPIQILMDSRITHNFLDEEMAKRLGCLLKNTKPTRVLTDDGKAMECKARCKNFEWLM